MTPIPRSLTIVEKRIAAFGPAVIALVLGAAVLIGMDRARASRARVTQAHELIRTLDHTFIRLLDAETGVRGYYIVGDSAYLAPYLHAGADVRAGLARLRALNAERPEQLRLLDAFDSLSARRLALLDSAVRVRHAPGFTLETRPPATGHGRATMDSARQIVAALQVDESRLLTSREGAEGRYTRLVTLVVGLGSLIAALLGFLANRTLSRYAAAQVDVARLLDQSNAELRERAEERERLVTELGAANQAKMRFLTTMSHELRTPLNAIDGYAELLMLGIRGPVTDEQVAALERIRRSGRHLLGLINDILSFAKLEAGQVELHLADVRLHDALTGIETLVAPQLVTKGIAYRYVPCDPTLVARTDEDKLRQVVLNLVTNAIKFTDAGGTITVVCEADDEYARVRVTDTGRGIPPEKLAAIFDPFVQVGEPLTVTGVQHGVGLGLAISRDLVRKLGGELTVESALGLGSTFGFSLPLREPGVHLPTASVSPAAGRA